jgi:diguanylate cyclase (GGDEF)-like protein
MPPKPYNTQATLPAAARPADAPARLRLGLFAFLLLYARWIMSTEYNRLPVAPEISPQRGQDLALTCFYCLAPLLLICLAIIMDLLFPSGATLLPLFASLPVLCLCCFYAPRAESTTPPKVITSACILVICFCYLINDRTTESVLYYYFWVPPLVVFCLGAKSSLIFFLLFTAMLIALLVPQTQALLPMQLDPALRLRFIISMLALYGLSFMADLSLRKFFSHISALNKQMEEYSLTDPLTRQGNRRQCNIQLARLHSLYMRSGENFSFILLDLDRFKKINDRYGHLLGDEILCRTTDILEKSLRSQDRLYRWGGDEFIVILPDSQLEQARVAAERMRKSLESSPFIQSKIKIRLTASFGVHTVNAPLPMDEHLSLADKTLYRAKAAGGNRVACAE